MIRIYDRQEWGAELPKQRYGAKDALGIVIHNMQSRNREPSNSTVAEKRLAFELSRNCQYDHMQNNGWSDIGQNFTLSRGGIVLEGRFGTKSAATGGRVVRGAHASGLAYYNEHYFGIELEGDNREEDLVTYQQWKALVTLCAQLTVWARVDSLHIVDHGGVLPGHTDCPGKFKLRMDELDIAVGKRVAGMQKSTKPQKNRTVNELSFVTTDYLPPAESLAYLGKIDPAKAEPVKLGYQLKGLKYLAQFKDSGILYFEADMDSDADGSPNYKKLDPQWGQKSTAYVYPGDGRGYLDAEKIPYIVMPGMKDSKGRRMYEKLGINKGDLAAVIWKGRLAFAIFGDVGPSDKIGEGSVKLVQDLGFDPFNSKGQIVRGIPGGVIYLIFPGSQIKRLKPGNAVAQIVGEASKMFVKYGGNVNPDVTGKLQEAKSPARKALARKKVARIKITYGVRVVGRFMILYYADNALKKKISEVSVSGQNQAIAALKMGQLDFKIQSSTAPGIAIANIAAVAGALTDYAIETCQGQPNDEQTPGEVASKISKVLTDRDKTIAEVGNLLDEQITFPSYLV